MVQLFLSDFRSPEIYTVYDIVPERHRVWDLKEQIEDAEGIPAGSQRLEFNGLALENSQFLEEYSIPDNGLISLVPTPVLLAIDKSAIDLGNEPRFISVDDIPQSVTFPIDLNIADLETFEKKIIRKLGVTWFSWAVKDGKGIRLQFKFCDRMLSSNQTLFEQGIREGDTINAICEIVAASQKLSYYDMFKDAIPCSYEPVRSKVVTVNHNWNGQMKHPRIRGKPLKQGECFSIPEIAQDRDWISIPRSSPREYFPSTLLSITKITTATSPLPLRRRKSESSYPDPVQEPRPTPENRSQSSDPDPINEEEISLIEGPRLKLPPFEYPKATPLEFLFKVADGGHSLINVTLDYNEISSPDDDTTLVRVKVLCQSFGTRRISAISIHITIPGDEIVDFEPKERFDSEEIVTKFAVRDRATVEYGLKSVGVNSPIGYGVQVGIGASKGKEREVGFQGKQSSRKMMMGNVIQGNTVCWSAKEALTGLGGNGLEGEQGEMWFMLKGKPDVFEYDCRVTHVKDQKEKTKQAMSKSWFQRHFG
ncbi:hypothetical protein VKT23_016533 [Stygiomarasmius scandens]|uniref:Ubiquitin-like domain-containing protein n=1 Tax=Marasmiellus scandens TaxID=2682957 RepID=A0ABR1IYS0_9AGAR